MRLKVRLLLWASVFAVVLPISCGKRGKASPPEGAAQPPCRADYPAVPSLPTRDSNMAMGNPSGAGVSNANNFLMEKPQYAMSYNDSLRICNWVSWHLSAAWLGDAPRNDSFRADTALPPGWVRVSKADYAGSGFDRGHICPSADRTASAADNSATFLMSNIIPQAPKSNQVTWAQLENYCRTLVSAGNELYIISGPYGQGGSNIKGMWRTISSKSIAVPSHLWKIVVVLPVGSNDVDRISTSIRIIAVWMPNSQRVGSHHWGYYRTSVDYIEDKTGYDFLSNVPQAIQAELEAKTDTLPTS